jgi:hypothetical protein
MIENERTQNILVVITIIVSLVSVVGLMSSSSYYGGSYMIIQNLEIDLDDVYVSNVVPTNTSINPSVSVAFSVEAPEAAAGKATITYMRAQIFLNGESFQYAEFRRAIGYEDGVVTSGYNKTFSVGSTITQMQDKEILYNASLEDNWTFSITLTMWYHMFEARGEDIRVLVFAHQGID